MVDQEEVAAVQVVEQRRGVLPAGDCLAQRGRQFREDRGFQQKSAPVARLAVQHFFRQKIEHIAVGLRQVLNKGAAARGGGDALE